MEEPREFQEEHRLSVPLTNWSPERRPTEGPSRRLLFHTTSDTSARAVSPRLAPYALFLDDGNDYRGHKKGASVFNTSEDRAPKREMGRGTYMTLWSDTGGGPTVLRRFLFLFFTVFLYVT